MDTNIIIAYKINNNWIYTDDFKKIPDRIDGLKINNYFFEGFKKIGCIIEASSNHITIVWIVLENNKGLELYKLINNNLIKIPLINFKNA